MNEETVKNWIKRGESDLKIGKDELQTTRPATDAICFHAQQCVEKYLKAYLILKGREISKTHYIKAILKQCIEINPDFKYLLEIDADKLTRYAVDGRYGEFFYFPLS